ncbi:hypothetical protein N0V82_009392 [Gnomoniopsis sp. IMI 355080]|nr:hypothetical protein N0V82_009392 [Gnomoniopsis sp. IMI 355080]
MRAIHSFRAPWRHYVSLDPRKQTTTRAITFASIKKELLSRQPRTYTDRVVDQKLKQLFVSVPPLNLPKNEKSLDFDTFNDFYCLLTPGSQPLLPQGHHLIFNNAQHPIDSLLPDGTDSDHCPGPPFTHRLWAGGSIAFPQGWRYDFAKKLNATWTCRETITDVRLKGCALPGDYTSIGTGIGQKIFVDVKRDYQLYSSKGLHRDPFIVERRTLCFVPQTSPKNIKEALEQPSNKSIRTPISFPQDCAASYSQTFNFTPTMLFRFSALTFNAHKIHLDLQHCRKVEGYRNLLVHGPLLLMLMFSVLNSRGHMVASLDYQNLAPVFVDEEIKVRVQQRKSNWSVYIVGPQNDLRVKGTAILEEKATNGHCANQEEEEADESNKKSMEFAGNERPSTKFMERLTPQDQ